MAYGQPYEYLDAGPPEPATPNPRRSRLLPWVLAGVAVLLGALVTGLLVADWAMRNVEMRALVSAVESSEQAMTDTQAAVREAFAPYAEADQLDEGQQAELRQALTKAAGAGAAAVADAGARVEDVRILPWHTSVQEARTAYLAHNRAWRDYLTAATREPGEFLAPQDAIRTTWLAAEPVVRDAVPWPALFDLAARVDRVFTEGDAPDDGDGGDGGGDGPTVSIRAERALRP